MTTLLVPPHGDVTLQAAADGVAAVSEPGRRFVRDLISGQSPATGGAADVWTRTARIAADEGDTLLRLRALDALLAGTRRPGHGVTLRLDDLELASGSSERLSDVLTAADAPAPYDTEVSASAARIGESACVRVVIDRDQQLPAALRALSQMPDPARLEVTGRFASRHWPQLRSVPGLHEAVLLEGAAPRWRVAPEWSPPGATVAWRERATDPVPAGRWAGRVSLYEILRAGGPAVGRDLERAMTVVIGVCGLADGLLIGRGGTRAPVDVFRRALSALRAMGVRPVAELWLGAPGITVDHIRECVAALRDEPPVVGFRVFDWPAGWQAREWGGHPVTVRERPGELSRRHSLVSPPVLGADERDALLLELAAPLRRDRRLVPGRVAGAYLWPARDTYPAGTLLLDEDAVVAPHPDSSRLAAVSFRTGTAVTLPGALRTVLGTGRGCGPRPVAPASGGRFDAVVGKLVHTGILRRVQ
jgi:hypothetical protein